MSGNTGTTLTRRRTYAVVVVAALVVGAVLAPVAWERTNGPDGRVAVVSIDGFVSTQSVGAIQEDLREARENESIRAVVLKVDSPGGSAAASEQLYMAVQRTAKEMTVVASVQSMGASGAYYGMLPAENIYVTPASVVGSVGVRGSAPRPVPSNQIRSGPDKASTTADQRRAQIETLKQAFVGSVMKHRGDDLALSRTEVAHAKVYTGARAVDNGMADKIGSLQDAIHEAAQKEGLDDYEVVRKEPPRRGGLLLLSANAEGENPTVVVEESPVGYDGVRTSTFLMVHGTVQYEDEVIGNVST
ncbi:MAG: S49 family peptidase [Haloferacaceae archaeon]